MTPAFAGIRRILTGIACAVGQLDGATAMMQDAHIRILADFVRIVLVAQYFLFSRGLTAGTRSKKIANSPKGHPGFSPEVNYSI